jgi:hypothetical protein
MCMVVVRVAQPLLCMSSDQSHFASSFDDTIAVLMAFIGQGWHSVEVMAEVSRKGVLDVIDDFEVQDCDGLASTLLEIAKAIVKDPHHGFVPQTKAGLRSVGLEEPLISLLLQQAYASSELVISPNTRKVLVALDMVDWEEFGSTKSQVKMGKVTPEKVQKGLRSWLPKGEGMHFHDTMDSIGGLIIARSSGDWGKLEKVLTSHFAHKEKEALLEMANSIFQLSKTTRASPKKARRNQAAEDDEATESE